MTLIPFCASSRTWSERILVTSSLNAGIALGFSERYDLAISAFPSRGVLLLIMLVEVVYSEDCMAKKSSEGADDACTEGMMVSAMAKSVIHSESVKIWWSFGGGMAAATGANILSSVDVMLWCNGCDSSCCEEKSREYGNEYE